MRNSLNKWLAIVKNHLVGTGRNPQSSHENRNCKSLFYHFLIRKEREWLLSSHILGQSYQTRNFFLKSRILKGSTDFLVLLWPWRLKSKYKRKYLHRKILIEAYTSRWMLYSPTFWWKCQYKTEVSKYDWKKKKTKNKIWLAHWCSISSCL